MAGDIAVLTGDMLLHAVLRSGLLSASYIDDQGQQQPAGPLFVVQVRPMTADLMYIFHTNVVSHVGLDLNLPSVPPASVPDLPPDHLHVGISGLRLLPPGGLRPVPFLPGSRQPDLQ